jgi:3-ketosteroid 9alpha-monooxygenase subunit A
VSTARAASDGFPHAGYPCGWYQIAWAAELEPLGVMPLRYFGRDFVLYRGRNAYHVLDAHCPHMGAHLGYGGLVSGESITCPYHGWRWGGDGRNELVPLEKTATDRCRIRSWHTAVANQIVWLWFDERGNEPRFSPPTDLPGVAERKRYDVHPHCARVWRGVRARPQYVAENNVDVEHLRWIHGARGPITLAAIEEDGYRLRTRNRIVFGYGKDKTRLTPDGPIEVEVTAELWGLAFQLTFFPQPDDAVSIAAQTPVDEHHCDLFQSVIVYGTDPGFDPASHPTGVAASRVREQLVQVERDIPIWQNMKYLPDPSLSAAEAPPLNTVRSWAKRFYPAY